MRVSRISVTTNAERVSLNIQRRARKLVGIAVAGAEIEGKVALERARQMSELSDHSLAELRRMGHPYARYGGLQPPHAPEYIHRQSGTFLANWRRSLSHSAMGATGTLYNKTRYAAYLERGTDFISKTGKPAGMIARPLLQKLAEEIRAMHPAVYGKLYRAAMK